MNSSKQFVMLSFALISACTSDKQDEIFVDSVPREIQVIYETQLKALGDRDIELKRVELAKDFTPLSALSDATAKSLAEVRAPNVHVNMNVTPALIEHRPAGWWPISLTKVRETKPDVAYAVLDVETIVDGEPMRYTALAFRTPAGIRVADPVLDPDPPQTGSIEDFTATAGGIVSEIPDTDGCNNLKYTSGKEAVARFIQNSWGLDNRSVMEWKYKFGHIVTVDCKKNAAGDKCVAVNKTVDFQQDVLNSRQCSPWFSSTTSCEGIVDWSQGNTTFESGNSLHTYYSNMQLAGDNKFDDIYDAAGASSNRTGYHFRAIGQARILTTYDFRVAPALPLWGLYLVNGLAAGYYATHLIKFLHWVVEEKKGDENPWFVAQADGQWNSEVEMTCPALNAPAAPGGGGGGMPPPPMMP